MVKFIYFLLVLLPMSIFAGEFSATISRNPVALGESFVLSLTLKDASANAAPSVTHLKNSFIINSQQQSTNTVIRNGHFSSSNVWKITLIAQKEGEVVIPSISINTSEGTLSTDPITIVVTKGSTGSTQNSELKDMTLTVDVSKAKPYKNEPLFYTVRLTTKVGLADLGLQKFTIEDAIIEQNGEPKVFNRIVDGVNVNIIDFSYIITPLKAGPLKVPSVTLQGGIPVKARGHRGGSFFDDNFDRFFSGFDQLKPFALMTEELTLDVQAPVAGVTPWLPAKSLTIEEVWDSSQKLQVGEPITRSFKIVADGAMSSQLPSLSDLQQVDESGFKSYTDKPETGDEILGSAIHSFRKEQFTLIPQIAGSLTLPEITVAWWDVNKNEKAFAKIPAKTLEILPKPQAQNGPVAMADEAFIPFQQPAALPVQRDPLLYVMLGGLALLLLGAIIWGISLQKKIGRLTEAPAPLKQKPFAKKENKTVPIRIEIEEPPTTPPTKPKKEKLPDLNPT